MFFFLSKIFEFFIYPLSWVLILMVLALLVKKIAVRRKLFIAAFAVLVIFSNPFLLNQFAQRWDITTQTLNPAQKYSCAIVLGGFSSEMGNDSGYFNWSADRFIQALKLYTTGKVSHILVTGGNGTLLDRGFKEADWVHKELKAFKVPDSCILIEDKSRNTLENAAFTKVILARSGLKPPYVLVTSGFHMRRSLAIFGKQHIPVVPFSCNFIGRVGNITVADLVPDGGTLLGWNIYIKELIGSLVNKLRS
jgi:uncharacterized SAM-binding protein YcdF (DUF218 family)